MPLLQLKHHSVVPILAAALLGMISPAIAGSRATKAMESTMTIPGGISAVARIMGLDESSVDPDSGIERIFTAILESEPPAAGIIANNPVRRDLISYLKQYEEFLGFLRSEGLVPSDPGRQEFRDIRFPFTGKRAELEDTQKLFSYFGMKCRIRAGQGITGTIEIQEGRGASRRQSLYRALRLQPPDRDLRELRIPLQSGVLPMIFDDRSWERILSAKDPASLFRRFVENPHAMRLYLALATCSPTTRRALADSIDPSRLLKSSEALLLFGSDLKFENGTLIFPGLRQSWTCLPDSPPLSLNSLVSANGLPLLLYSSVSAAPAPVRQYLTASSERLRSYFDILSPYGSGGFQGSVAAAVAQELPRIFRLLTVNANGLVLDLDERISKPLLRRIAPDLVADSGSGPVPLNPKILARLLPRPGVSPYAQTSRADILEFFRHLERVQPGSLSTESIRALMKSPEAAPIYLDLIGDLAPDSTVLSGYLEYCRTLAQAGRRGWNPNRTRTSQSVFFLISALRREGAVSQAEANKLLEEALEAFRPDDEALFAFNAADFLSRRLMPQVSRNAFGSRDPLLSALSGNQPPRSIVYGGKEFAFDLSARRYRGMQETLQSQSYTPIPVLLDIFNLSRKIQNAAGAGNRNAEIKLLSDRLNEIRTAESTPGGSANQRGSVARVRIDRIGRKIKPEIRAHEIAEEIHTELGVTLLAYCYAYSARPDINVLAFDPNFVRKHSFYRRDPFNTEDWIRSHFVQDEELGGFMEGSLAGLGFEMTRLQIAQSDRDFGITSNIDIAPSILFGVRQVRPELRTDRSQEYVALATRLGNTLASLSSVDEPIGRWIREILTPLLSPRRLEAAENRRAGVLSPSELFLLGQAYLHSKERRAAECSRADLCSTVDKLDAIVPKPGSVEYNAFQNEVRQYGIMLRSRIGLSRFSFDMIDSYERLEKNIRPQDLYDRICDLKIRLAELNHSLGLPAALGELEADQALQVILAPSSGIMPGRWQDTIERINGLTEQVVLGWIHELIARGSPGTEHESPRNPGL